MKNENRLEIIETAVTGIGDDLIEEAAQVSRVKAKKMPRLSRILPIAAALTVLLAGSAYAAVRLLKPGYTALPKEEHEVYPADFTMYVPGKGEVALYAGDITNEMFEENLKKGKKLHPSHYYYLSGDEENVAGNDIDTPVQFTTRLLKKDGTIAPVYHDSEYNLYFLDAPNIVGGDFRNSLPGIGKLLTDEELRQKAWEFLSELYDLPDDAELVSRDIRPDAGTVYFSGCTKCGIAWIPRGFSMIIRRDGQVIMWSITGDDFYEDFDPALLDGITEDHLKELLSKRDRGEAVAKEDGTVIPVKKTYYDCLIDKDWRGKFILWVTYTDNIEPYQLESGRYYLPLEESSKQLKSR